VTKHVRHLAAIMIAMFAILQSGKAHACSLSGDFVGTTNFELVRNADAIVVAEAVSASQTEDAGTVEYRVLEVIKGDPPDRVHNDFANFGTAVPSRPMTFIGANPDSAGCVRTAFEPGGKYVLFLNAESDQRYVVRRDTHARIAEDYDGPDSYWVRAIRYYMSAQDGPDQMEQLAFLETEVQRLSQFEDQSFERILQLDIADHLSTLSMAKPTDYLVRAFEGAYGGKIFPDFGNLPGPEGSETINQILGLAPLFDDDTQTDLNDRMKTRALNALSRRSDATAASFFTQRVDGGSQDPELLGAAIRFFVRFGELEKARMLAEQHAFVVLNLAPQDGAARFHSGMGEFDRSPAPGTAPYWKNHPEIAAWWPAFSFAARQTMHFRFGYGLAFSISDDAELEALRPVDYRTNPNLSFAIADSYDDHIVDWAEQEVARLISAGVETYEEDYAVPLGVLLIDYSSDRRTRIETMFCGSEEGRYLVLRYLGKHPGFYTGQLAFQLAAQKLDIEERETLLSSLYMFAAHDRKDSGYVDSDTDNLINRLIKGKRVSLKNREIEPLVCK
jgi:hypothetical protein